MNVAIVNDSKMAVEILRRIVAQLPEFTLAWTAYSGEEAIELCAQSRPDIILMDLVMPGIDGAETTRRIMQATPCVILVVTATTVGNRDMVFEAMGYGALDAVNTPVLGPGQDLSGAEPLIQKLRIVSRLAGSLSRAGADPRRVPARSRDTSDIAVVAIGASTGGPQALAEILSHFPAGFPAAVIVVQHVDRQFTSSLAGWLQHVSKVPVSIAEPDARLSPGTIWIAGREENLTFDNGFARYTPAPRRRDPQTVDRYAFLQPGQAASVAPGGRAADRDGTRRRRWPSGAAHIRSTHHCAGCGHVGGLRYAQSRGRPRRGQ